jgi:hypothetical protein
MISFKRCASVLLAVALLLTFSVTGVFAEPDGEANEAPAGMHGIITASVLNVRSGPGTDHSILGQLKRGAYVDITAVQPGWVRIAFQNGDAYVSTDFVMIRTGPMPARSRASAANAQAIVERAKQYLGVPYRWGGTTPAGFDCSGFMMYLHRQFGVTLNRVASDQMRNGTPVDRADLVPGDMVFFTSSAGSSYVSHVGMYVGDGQMIHAPNGGGVVRYASINDSYRVSTYAGARRIFHN